MFGQQFAKKIAGIINFAAKIEFGLDETEEAIDLLEQELKIYLFVYEVDNHLRKDKSVNYKSKTVVLWSI